MPKTESNTRPYNRPQKRASARNKKVIREAEKVLGPKSGYSGTGPGRSNTSPGMSAQATRSLALQVAKQSTKTRKPKGK